MSILDNAFNKLYNQDTIAKLEAQYGFGGSGLPSQARHQAAVNELAKTLTPFDFGPANLLGKTAAFLGASATEVPDLIKTGDFKEAGRDIRDNFIGAFLTDQNKTPADVFAEVYGLGDTGFPIKTEQTGGITGVRDFSEFDKARMGAQLAARGVSPDVISQIDKQTADEEGALLDDAFEKQLAIATRTGNIGPIEGIMKAINPKNIAGFITDSLPFTLAAQGLSSITDRLGIRTGMQEPPGAVGRGGYGVSRPGNTLTNQTRANRAQFSDFYSNFQGGAQHHMGKRVDDVISRTGSGRRTRSDAQKFVNTYGSEEQKKNFQAAKEQNRRDKLTEQFKSEEGNTGGGSKIVCTMMNKSYGFGSFRNKIWMKFHKDLSPEYQKGYHRIFLPLVKIAKKNKIVRKILEHIAVHSTIDMRQSMRGKKHLLGRLYRKIILPICYWAGKK